MNFGERLEYVNKTIFYIYIYIYVCVCVYKNLIDRKCLNNSY